MLPRPRPPLKLRLTQYTIILLSSSLPSPDRAAFWRARQGISGICSATSGSRSPCRADGHQEPIRAACFGAGRNMRPTPQCMARTGTQDCSSHSAFRVGRHRRLAGFPASSSSRRSPPRTARAFMPPTSNPPVVRGQELTDVAFGVDPRTAAPVAADLGDRLDNGHSATSTAPSNASNPAPHVHGGWMARLYTDQDVSTLTHRTSPASHSPECSMTTGSPCGQGLRVVMPRACLSACSSASTRASAATCRPSRG